MTKVIINAGIFHRVPKDIKMVLQSNAHILELWNGLTSIARNEWICWITIVKKDETRVEHLKRFCIELQQGKRRPCCWPGCPHRKPHLQK